MKPLVRAAAVLAVLLLAAAQFPSLAALSPFRPKLEVFVTGNPVPFVLQPAAGLNDGTDLGTASAGMDTFGYLPEGSLIFGDNGLAGIYTSDCNGIVGNAYLRFALDGMPVSNIESARITVYVWVHHSGTCGWPWEADPLYGGPARDLRLERDDAVRVQPAHRGRHAGDPGDDLRGGGRLGGERLEMGQLRHHGSLPRLGRGFAGELRRPVQHGQQRLHELRDRRVRDLRHDDGARIAVFSDDFSDGTPGETDPHWDLKNGSWKVATPAGYPDGNLLKSSTAPMATVLVRPESILNYPFASGTISVRLKVGAASSLANANVFFDSTDKDHYRMVRLKQKATGWYLQLVQNGDYDGDTARVVAAVKLKGFSKKHWHALELTLGSDGAASALLTDEEDPARTWTLNGSFAANTGGDVGLFTKGTVLMVDDYVLTPPAGE